MPALPHFGKIEALFLMQPLVAVCIVAEAEDLHGEFYTSSKQNQYIADSDEQIPLTVLFVCLLL